MENFKTLEVLISNKTFQFFLWVGILQLLAQVFLERRFAFWVSILFATALWAMKFELLTPLKAWLIVLTIMLIYFLPKKLFEFNLFLHLRGKKRCPMCFSEIHKRAKICPFCKSSLERL
ncbi:MAG: hypothetical protein NZL90_01460 [Aquificaceae bacterium]|nr:hypothetical protein [Aquificaceae bacterium]MDW8237196.1 hypothetical protein [Aquificaceae bacterium]